MTTDRAAYILCPFGKESGLYAGWSEELSVPCQIIDNYRTDWVPPDDAAILISHMHYRWEECHVLRKVVERANIPVLILADGIIEYRNTWQNPQIADAAVFQPVVGHKIACIGRAQARILESWGNVGKCEVVGMPRFDRYLGTAPEPRDKLKKKQFRVLVATATSPYFTEQQQQVVIQSLCDINEVASEVGESTGGRLQVIYRLTADLDKQTGIASSKHEPLFDILDSVDSLITTPSTLMLEGWLKRKPVAVLDYSNSPQYVPAAWTISCREQIPAVFDELADPPTAKLLFQSSTLSDQLECQSPAGPRMIELVDTMIELGQAARSAGRKLSLPTRILADRRYGFQPVDSSFQLADLYPDNQAFRSASQEQLQAELAQAIHRLGQLPDDLLECREYNRYLAARLDEVRLRLRKRNSRVWDLRQEVALLEKKIDTLSRMQDAGE